MESTIASQAKLINQLTEKISLKEEDEQRLLGEHQKELWEKSDRILSLENKVKSLESKLDVMKELEQQREREKMNCQSTESLLPGFLHSLKFAKSADARENVMAILHELRTRTDAKKVVFYEIRYR